jgi:fibronectin type 3 domain-containing protein
MYIAGSLNPGQGMDGMFGELKIYRGVMTDTEYEAERDALMAKWVQNAPIDVTAGADASDITLAWVDPNPTASLTYSVYRSEVSGTYTTALASGLPSTNYTDSSAAFGTTYYYVVTATRDGIESGFSAEVLEATTAASALYAHYDASDASNVTLENTNEVTDLADLSGNNYNADVGSLTAVLYPDASQSATGLDFLDMGTSNNRLRTLLPPEQDALLNFAPDTGTGAGEAASNSGFSFFVVARVDALLGGIIRDVVLGNAGEENAGLVLKLAGEYPELHLGGVEAINSSVAPEAGDTLVFAANYNNVTQQLEFWNSKANASVTVAVPAADFSTAAAIFIGGSNNPDQYLDGAIGEVKFYEGRMSPAAFAAEQLALSEKWITGSPSTDFTSWVDGSFTNGTLSDKTAGGDDDNDGISNLIEFAIEGEDPTVSNTSVGTFTGLTLSFNKRQTPVISGITYTIEQSTDLGVADAWEAVAATEDASSISFTLPGGIPKDFMRLQVTEE